jgi:hypothetical protein
MAKEIDIRTRAGVFRAKLDDSDLANAIWLSKPITIEINMITGMIYGELPLAAVMPREGRTTQLETGDVAYWPAPGAFCIFYGPTPLSGEDGKPVSPYPVIKIGHIDGDCSALDGAGDRMKIILDPIYRFGARARICSRRTRPSLWGPRIPGRSTRRPPVAWTRAWPGRA